MSRDEIVAGIARVAERHLGYRGEVVAERRLIEDLGLDSLQRLVLAAELENEFRVAFAPEEEAAIATVGELAAAIERKLAG
jgi:acyl carrier protein